MKLQAKTKEEPEINLTSLIDVVFLLLIFFMVTTTFERQAKLRIDLPEASEEPVTVTADSMEIAINSEGTFYVNSNEVVNRSVETLMGAITKATGDDRNLPVTIKADGRTPHQSVVTAMDALSRLGFVNLSIATTPGSDG